MRTTIDRAGRVVIPRRLRETLGLGPGEVEVTQDGAGIRIEAVPGQGTVDRRGRLVIDADLALTDAEVRNLRLADQR